MLFRNKKIPCSLQHHPADKRADDDTDGHSSTDFKAGVTENLDELLGGEVVILEDFVDDLVQEPGLKSRGPAHGGGIEHHHNRKREADGKDRAAEPFLEAYRRGQPADHGGMRAGHAAQSGEVLKVNLAGIPEVSQHFQE